MSFCSCGKEKRNVETTITHVKDKEMFTAVKNLLSFLFVIDRSADQLETLAVTVLGDRFEDASK